MSRSFVLSEKADDDMSDGRRYYNRQRPGLGFDFIDEVEDAFNRIRRAPDLAPPVFQDLRKVLVNRFPYHVIYRVDDAQITIVAVYHTSRDPKGWQSRV